MKRTSGQAYLAERDKAAGDGAAKQTKPGWKGGGGFGFGDFLREHEPRKIDFDPLLSSPCEGSRLIADVKLEESISTGDKAVMPKCSWYTLQHNQPPVGPVESNSLDLSKVGDGVVLVVLVAQTAEKQTINDTSTNAGSTVAKAICAWRATLSEGPAKDRKDLLRIRRPQGPKSTGVWLIAGFIRGSAEDRWHAEAIDEVYPEKRLKTVLPLRFKELVPPAEEKEEEDPMAAARRMLEEAMKG
eukprot:TRINITY_DN25398_c0_g2_i1.p1 TRINITY_DN25398_c0_g2~~TRINITY_DN25398_c0_g2_i1.p1  ORF type:complete len:243 (-),score=67.56 TRINITY_DN25398_c0_g2_i1:87-815(-)